MKKRVISLLLALVLAVSLLPTAAFAAETDVSALPEFSEGADTSTIQKFKISSADSLKALATAVKDNDGNGAYNLKGLTFYLANDIELSGTWTPISDVAYPADAFAGTFDGNGHTISGLNGSNGLFGFVNGATIKNLKVEGTISGSTTGIGGIVGKTQGPVTIDSCVFSGKISASYTETTKANGIGGIVGRVNNGTLKIFNCMNIGDVQATGTCGRNGMIRVGGVLGLSAKSGTIIKSCYSSGTISDKPCGGITGALTNSGSKIKNCCWTQPDEGNGIGSGSLIDSRKVTSATDALAILGDAFTMDDSGNVILKWEAGSTPAEKNPRIVISGGSTLQMTNSGEQPHTTLTVAYKGMENRTPTVIWSASNDCVILTAPDNASAADNIRIAQANKPGTVTITATVDDETIEPATFDIDVLPFVSGLNYTNTATGGSEPVIGQEVRVDVVTIGNKIFSSDKLSFAWWNNTTNTPIAKTTENTFVVIPDSFNEWNYLGVDVFYNGAPIHSHADHQQYVRSAEYGKAYVVAQDIALPTDITEETVLTLPAVHTKDGETVNIEWSSKDIAITDNTVKLTLPESGKKTIKLSAKCTLADTNTAAYRTFTIYVWSPSSADENTLNEAASKLENMGALHPRFGKDSNVQTMVETRLANAGFSGVGVKFISAEPTNATADQAASAISSIGGITYFYDDPNKTVNERTQWFDTYKAYFTLTCGSETQENVAVPVTVYWDVNKVCRVMTEEVLDRVTLPELTEGNLTLPASGKWTTISWTSSDPTIIANDGTITRSTIDQQAVLTATFTFNFTSDVTGNEQPIVLYKVFEVTVKGNADAADRAALYQQKLNDALAAPGLKDFVTGAKLTADANGVYTTSNDIQFPTTRDLKIDGKYTPVVITSSDPGVIEAPTTPNSARVWVYRPLPGEAAKTVTLTMKILDRPNGPQPGDDLSAMRVLASKEIKVTVQPLTQDEIDAEIALMERVKVKVNYWNGIRNANVERDNVTTDLHAFQECYLNDNGELTWVYDREDLKNHGIVPVPLDNWYDQQIWRLFRSSNAGVVAHENLLVTRQGDSKAVTITSYLSSETLGKYAEKYPQNADFQKLYKQPVTIDLVVTGTQYAQGNNEGRVQAAKRALAVRPTVTVSFSLSGRGMGFTESNLEYAEGSTVYDVFSDLLAEHRYTCKRRGSYIAAITSNSGVTLEEFDEGKNSGWMYRVNGELVGRYMSAQGLNDGDRIELYFTSDWTSEPGAEGWQKPGKIETIVNADGSVTKIETKSDGTVIETTTWRDGSTLTAETSPNGRVETVEKRADGTTVETVESASGGITASVSVPKSVGSTRVDIPVSKPTGSMVAVIVHPDGTEEIVRGSVVTETGVALRAEGDVRLKIIDNAKRFNDMADHWAKDAVEFASSRELFNGVCNDAFGPDLSMTRGMVSTVLARLAGADTAGGETWYAKGTVWAVENGISDGTAPEQPVTREQLAAMLYRYAGSPAVSGELGFDDADSISAWARDAVRWCVDNGILNGVGGNRMTPQDLARRGQVAAMLMRFLQATV